MKTLRHEKPLIARLACALNGYHSYYCYRDTLRTKTKGQSTRRIEYGMYTN